MLVNLYSIFGAGNFDLTLFYARDADMSNVSSGNWNRKEISLMQICFKGPNWWKLLNLRDLILSDKKLIEPD